MKLDDILQKIAAPREAQWDPKAKMMIPGPPPPSSFAPKPLHMQPPKQEPKRHPLDKINERQEKATYHAKLKQDQHKAEYGSFSTLKKMRDVRKKEKMEREAEALKKAKLKEKEKAAKKKAAPAKKATPAKKPATAKKAAPAKKPAATKKPMKKPQAKKPAPKKASSKKSMKKLAEGFMDERDSLEMRDAAGAAIGAIGGHLVDRMRRPKPAPKQSVG